MELLISRVHDHPLVALASAAGIRKGDVICIVPDGWRWTAKERENPDWLIVKSDLIETQAEMLLETSRLNEPRRYRRVGLDIEGLAQGDFIKRKKLMARVI